jgi:hypothetical protein
VKARIILTPQHAKDYLKQLERIFTDLLHTETLKILNSPDAALSFGPTGQGNLRYLIESKSSILRSFFNFIFEK